MSVFCGKNENKKKRVDRWAKPTPPRFNLQVMQVKFFLRVENINPPRQKVRVMRIRPVLSSLALNLREDFTQILFNHLTYF